MTRLRYERQRRQQSQMSLAREVQINQAFISMMERHLFVPGPAMLARLAQAFPDVPPDELLKDIVVVTERAS